MHWHDDTGVVSPADFIPLAEETGLIVPLGRQVLQRAVEQVSAWQRQRIRFGRLHINVSPNQLAQPDFCKELHDAIAAGHIRHDAFRRRGD